MSFASLVCAILQVSCLVHASFVDTRGFEMVGIAKCRKQLRIAVPALLHLRHLVREWVVSPCFKTFDKII